LDHARVSLDEPGDDVQQGRLARPAGPQQGDEFPGLNVEADVIECAEVSVLLGHPADPYRGNRTRCRLTTHRCSKEGEVRAGREARVRRSLRSSRLTPPAAKTATVTSSSMVDTAATVGSICTRTPDHIRTGRVVMPGPDR